MRTSSILLAAISLMIGGSSAATPVNTTYTFGLTIGSVGTLSFTGTTTVDVVGSTVTIAAGQIVNPATIVVPVTVTTAFGWAPIRLCPWSLPP